MGVGSFKPLYLISKWKESLTTRQCLSIAILFPSGVNENFKLQITENGLCLQIEVTWPYSLTDVAELHSLWLVMERHRGVTEEHPKLGGFETAMRLLRETRSSPIKSVANIPLPFKVETEVTVEALYFDDCSCIAYVDLKSALDRYSNTTKKLKFKRVSSSFKVNPPLPQTVMCNEQCSGNEDEISNAAGN